jgi:hypothetical protein
MPFASVISEITTSSTRSTFLTIMLTITQKVIEWVQLCSPLSGIRVAKSLFLRWDGIHDHRSTTPSEYLALMPPEGLVDFGVRFYSIVLQCRQI